jgi:hypothetical protein
MADPRYYAEDWVALVERVGPTLSKAWRQAVRASPGEAGRGRIVRVDVFVPGPRRPVRAAIGLVDAAAPDHGEGELLAWLAEVAASFPVPASGTLACAFTGANRRLLGRWARRVAVTRQAAFQNYGA